MADAIPLTYEEVVQTIGPADDTVVAAIIATGATHDELAEARAWLANDEALINAGKALAAGRVGQLVRILARIEDEERGDAPQVGSSSGGPDGKHE